METAIAVTRLVFSGVRERHDFPLCVAHGGGCLPSLRGRLDIGWDRKAVARSTPMAPSTYIHGLFFDTAVFSDGVLADLVTTFGPGRVLVGTDFAFDLADRDPLASVAALGLDDYDSAQVRWRTAARLLRLNLDTDANKEER